MSPGLTIGGVLKALREEFPDLTVSKVRFLDAQGLVVPVRSESGYRRYSEEDVERLRFVLRAQRDRFWPLKVIREALDAYDRGLTPADMDFSDATPAVPQPGEDPDVPAAEALAQPSAHLELTRAELCRGADITEGFLKDLETFGLVRPGADGHFGEDDLAAAKAAGRLAQYGIEARHLRPFRLAADREIGLVQQVRARDEDTRADVASACLALHIALVKTGLRAN